MMNVELIQFFKEHKESLDMILDLLPVPVFTKDLQGRYITCNSAFEKFIGISRQDLVGKSVYDLWSMPKADIYHKKDQELFENPGLQVYETNVAVPGKDKAVQFHKVTFTDASGKVAGLLGVIFDRTTEKNLENELKHLAHYDSLTGLLNPRAGFDTLDRLFSESVRNKRVFSMAMMDIDHFKKINDKYGHATGDQVLQSVQQTFKDVLREYDFIFRYGDEEFMLCFPNTSIEEAGAISERLRVAFEKNEIKISTHKTIKITVSIGIASYPMHGSSVEELTKACDDALYSAKHSGRNIIKLAS